jgi:hypothetical protein
MAAEDEELLEQRLANLRAEVAALPLELVPWQVDLIRQLAREARDRQDPAAMLFLSMHLLILKRRLAGIALEQP